MSDVRGVISLKLADGTLFPILESLAPNKSVMIIEPANPDEEKVRLTFFLETEDIKEPVSVISVDMKGGSPSVSISVEVDPLKNLFIVVKREGAEERQVDHIALTEYLNPDSNKPDNITASEILGQSPSKPNFLTFVAVALFSIFGAGLALFTVYSFSGKMASPPFPPLRVNVENISH